MPFDAAEVLLFLFLLELALAMDRERVVLDADINVFLVQARDFKLQGKVVLVFVDVDRRREAGGGQRLLWAYGAISLANKTVHAVFYGGVFTVRIPVSQLTCKHSNLLEGCRC